MNKMGWKYWSLKLRPTVKQKLDHANRLLKAEQDRNKRLKKKLEIIEFNEKSNVPYEELTFEELRQFKLDKI
jgi:adenine C2-methylase RlmN of 23S rRNA A2503 and tRNA A37|tara:strand:- start:865 stop:1080 length:216 start_codon:yes stop_codon:yes gene_type:complete